MRVLKIIGIAAFWGFAAWFAFVVWKKDDYRRHFLAEIRVSATAEMRSALEAGLPEFPSRRAIAATVADEAARCMMTDIRIRLRPNDLVLYRASFEMLGEERIVARKVRLPDEQRDECIQQGLKAAEPLMQADLKRSIAELLLKSILTELSGRK